MAITRPVTRTIISTTDFGIPVADQLNTLQTQVATLIPGAWQTMTLLNGFTADPWTAGVRIRKIGPVVYCAGAISNPSGLTAQFNVFNIPSGFRPATNTRVPLGGYYGGGGEVQAGRGDIATGGGVNIQMANNTFLIIFNCWWMTD